MGVARPNAQLRNLENIKSCKQTCMAGKSESDQGQRGEARFERGKRKREPKRMKSCVRTTPCFGELLVGGSLQRDERISNSCYRV